MRNTGATSAALLTAAVLLSFCVLWAFVQG
jgi:hypothetical protein